MPFKLKNIPYPGISPKKFIPPSEDVSLPGSDVSMPSGIGINPDGDPEGGNIDGEYYLSAEEMMTPGIKAKLREENPGIQFYGEHAQMVEKKRKKAKRKLKRGKVVDWETGEYKKVRRGKGLFG